ALGPAQDPRGRPGLAQEEMNQFRRLMERRRRTFLLAASVAVLALAVAFLVDTVKTQWDLKIYMECSRTLASGADPYKTQPVFNGDHFQCLYPPVIMDLYRPFNFFAREFGQGAGERHWAVLKVLSMALMLWAALAAFIAERDYLFAALIAAAAQPKILPAAFLPLVLAKRRPNWGAFVFGGVLGL